MPRVNSWESDERVKRHLKEEYWRGEVEGEERGDVWKAGGMGGALRKGVCILDEHSRWRR